ncbi:FxDxF family PEP-CTERM protein [Methylophilus aquaticus]|uniref:FxDxF family PEP-CTERM protein n=1 Tax=Methylophilus aquaticus TaxID=1971610 RepID=A0ABT9JTA7_9PROT|nr:FxDxF family PEP-CTERM protein [Methylophilus aquaticus]MDP8567795.1 FxDxF family PEP-CTERM protein [Methylophilus aquaticus]
MKAFAKRILAVSLLSVFAMNAEAATVSLGYGNTDLVANPSGGRFTDLYNFVLTGLSSIDYTVTVFNENLSVYTAPTFTTISIFKFQDGAAGFNYGLFDAANNKILDPSALSTGTYTLKVSGITTGVYGGKYSLDASVVSLPVPEPETSLMLLLGLVSIGTLVYRKNNVVNKI